MNSNIIMGVEKLSREECLDISHKSLKGEHHISGAGCRRSTVSGNFGPNRALGGEGHVRSTRHGAYQ